MNVQTDELAELVQPRRGESRCEYCGRPWFGLVAYCPYCGRKAGFTTVSEVSHPRLENDEALTSEQAASWVLPREQRVHNAESLRKQSRTAPVEDMPGLVENLPGQRNVAARSRFNKPGFTLLLSIVVAGALLVWLLVGLFASDEDERASPPVQRAITGRIESPPQTPVTNVAKPSPVPPSTDTSAPPEPSKSPLCSVMHERAGLCKSQE